MRRRSRTGKRTAPMNDDYTAQPRDDRTTDAFYTYGRLPTLEEQDWPEKPIWPGRDRWRSWD